MFKKFTVLAISLSLVGAAHAMTMQEVFDSVNAVGNVSNPSTLKGQTMNIYSGGSLFLRVPKRTYQLASVKAPSWSAGCGGIDLFMGGFGFINKDEFVAMLRNIGSNAMGYGFKLAIQNLCPTCDNVMQALQATAAQINRLNIDSCEAAKGLVNAAAPDKWRKGKEESAMSYGTLQNMYSNTTEAWGKVKTSESTANENIKNAAAANPDAAITMPKGNVVWKALKQVSSLDDDYRMILMSIIGTTVFDVDTTKPPESYPSRGIDIKTLIGSSSTEQLDLPVYKCADGVGQEQCLTMTTTTIKKDSFRLMVSKKMNKIADKIASRSAHDDVSEISAFLNATDFPVYKMIAMSTSLNNKTMFDSLNNRYQELIASKYAAAYIELAASDLEVAFAKFEKVSNVALSDDIKNFRKRLSVLRAQSQETVRDAYARTSSSMNIAMELQSLERGLNSNLSQTLRSSVAFSKGLR